MCGRWRGRGGFADADWPELPSPHECRKARNGLYFGAFSAPNRRPLRRKTLLKRPPRTSAGQAGGKGTRPDPSGGRNACRNGPWPLPLSPLVCVPLASRGCPWSWLENPVAKPKWRLSTPTIDTLLHLTNMRPPQSYLRGDIALPACRRVWPPAIGVSQGECGQMRTFLGATQLGIRNGGMSRAAKGADCKSAG